MKVLTKQQPLETNIKNVSPSFLKTDIKRWNVRFALVLSFFWSIAGLVGSALAMLFLLIFLLVGMPIIVRKYEIITITKDEKFLDMNKEEIDTNKLPHFFLIIGILAAIVFIQVMVLHLNPAINWLIIVFSFFFIPTFLFNLNNLPIFIIFRPNVKLDSNIGTSSSSSYSWSDESRKRTSRGYSYLPQNIHHKR